jgi:hypothetical protein
MTTHNDDAVREVTRQQRAERRNKTSTPRNDKPTRADLERELHYMASQVEQHGFPGTRAVLAELERLSKENAKLRQAVQDRDDTLSMVIGLPGFQRRHPQFAEGILTLLAPVDVTPAPPPPGNA